MVTKALSTADLVYSDSAEIAGHVNTADISAGSIIAPYYAITGGFSVNGTPDDTAITVSNFLFGQRYSKISVNVVDEDGDYIDDNNFTVYCDINGNYEITPPSLFGWEYSEASASLTGITDTDMEITLTYKTARHRITIKFVDSDGNAIREDLVKTFEYKNIYEIDDSEIEVKGYSFVESSRTLKGTVMSDMTITLTYSKNGGCSCGNSATSASVFGGLIIVLGMAFLRRK